MPTPCTNCLRFHYGECWEPVRQCHECQGFNHIERYCPNKKGQIKHVRGEPLAGTRSWCEMHGLHHDPELKRRVLMALKTDPGSAIYVNDVCIYLGSVKHFDTEYMPSRGRTLEERITGDRSRTRSPGRFARLPPAQNRGRSLERRPASPWRHDRYRSRTPPPQRQRTPSPYSPRHSDQNYQAKSPHYERDSNAAIFEARDRYGENRPQHHAEPSVKFSMPPPQPDFRSVASRNALQTSSGNTFNSGRTASGTKSGRDSAYVSNEMQGVLKQSQSQQFKESQSQQLKQSQSQMSPIHIDESPTLPSADAPIYVEDPHFVLGVTRGAGRDE